MIDVPSERRALNGVLVLYFDAGIPWAANQLQHARSFGRHSRFRTWTVNTLYDFPRQLAAFDFAAIILHYSLFGAVPGPLSPLLGTPRYLLNDGHIALLRAASGRKIAIFQDEQTHCRARFRFCDEFGIDCAYTCFEPDEYDSTWRRYSRVPTIRTTLPGYVDEALTHVADHFALPDDQRSVDVGYRARPIPLFAEPRQDKVEVGRRFREFAAGSDLVLDIGLREEDRLYGDDWFRFLGDSRTTLGAESGVSVVDCEDEVRNDCERILAKQGEVTLENLAQGPLARWDDAIRYRTISPRHFEAAALGSCQVLLEGSYSGAMRPMEHYIPLRRDFSNFDQVVSRIRDAGLRRGLAGNARRDLIDSGEYRLESFVAGVDRDLIDAGLDPEIDPRLARAVRRAWARGTHQSILRYRLKRRRAATSAWLRRLRVRVGRLLRR